MRWRINSLLSMRLLLVCISVPVISLSCGPQSTPVFPVRGTVVFGPAKKQAAGVRVFFHPVRTDDKNPLISTALTNENGIFEMTTRSARDGAPQGVYIVTLVWPPPRQSVFDGDEVDRLGGAFSNAASSKIRFTVQPTSTNEVPTIELP